VIRYGEPKLVLGALAVFCSVLRNEYVGDCLAPARLAPNVTARAHLPLRFEENVGQWDSHVRFATRSGGATIFIADDGPTIALSNGAKRAAIHMKLEGERESRPYGEKQLVTKSNFFIGNDPKSWHTNVPNYASVRAPGVVRGVDVVWHEGGGGLEYDLEVSKGVDARAIAFVIDGALSLDVAANGTLNIVTAAGMLAQQPPRVLQNGVELAARYRTDGATRAWLHIDAYDSSRSLLIDPMLVYSTYIGGTGTEGGTAIAVDSSGAAYVVGSTRYFALPTTTGAYETTYKTDPNDTAFVAKLDPTGSSLVYATYLGGSHVEEGLGVAVDPNGAVYVTGTTASTDFPTTTGAFQTSLNGVDAFVTKLDASGSSLVYSTLLGGSGGEQANAIALEANGDVDLVGFTTSADFPTTKGAYQALAAGNADGFVTKLDASGSSLVYSTYLGGSGSDDAVGLAIDQSGAVYVAGDTSSSDFPTTVGAYRTAYAPNPPLQQTLFVAKLDVASSSLEYSTYLGGADGDLCSGIAIDQNGNAYVTGVTQSSDFPTTANAFWKSCPGDRGVAFVTKLDTMGASLAYSTMLTCAGARGNGIAVNAKGEAIVTGYAQSDYPTTAGAFQTSKPSQGNSPFVTKLDASGALLVYSTFVGGGDTDDGNAIALDSSGDAYVTGVTSSVDFPATAAAYQAKNAGLADAFVAKLTQPELGPGAPCSLAEQCGSGYCVDGVCCDVACSGQCQACDVAGSAGKCTAVMGAPHGSRPACTACGSCDGTSTSMCSEPASATPCGASCCSSPNVCDPNGTCVVPTSSGCGCTTGEESPWFPALAAALIVGVAGKRRRTPR
jgi:MYXO-CTERM domain-containing protein